MSTMKFYLLLLNSISDFDSETEYINLKPVNYGLEFSYYPVDDLIEKDNKVFCTEKLYNTLLNPKVKFNYLSGTIFVNNIRVTKNENWIYLYGNSYCDPYIEIQINGIPFRDDFGLLKKQELNEVVGHYETQYLIVGELAVKALILGRCSNIIGKEITENEVDHLLRIQNEIYHNQGNYKIINKINDF